MPRPTRPPITAVVLLAALAAAASSRAADPGAMGFELTPPRLSYVHGDVAFFRPGGEDASEAEVNTPIAAGDELYAASGADLEVQIGARAWLRAGGRTQIAFAGLGPDSVRLHVSTGRASLDLRALDPALLLELDTPHGGFTIERAGYYRIDVEDDVTSFTARRGGRAAVTVASGRARTIASGEEIAIRGFLEARLESRTAPGLDDWDRWGQARTDRQLAAASARYVSSGIYGLADLDDHGDWRVVATYGAIWVPRRVAVGWAPYGDGRWIRDPYYGWAWLDSAPWGWAPYHYGRWVHVSGVWGWAPGPPVARPCYAPALVAFTGSLSLGLSFGGSGQGWVALGWGEPLLPWWGPSGFRAVAHWAGWAGPRIVNGAEVRGRTAVRVSDVHRYRSQRVRGALVALERGLFGRRSAAGTRPTRAGAERSRPRAGDLDRRPPRESRTSPRRAAGRTPRERVSAPERTQPRPRVAGRDRGERGAPESGSTSRRPSASPAAGATRRAPRHDTRRVGRDDARRSNARSETRRAPEAEASRREVVRRSRGDEARRRRDPDADRDQAARRVRVSDRTERRAHRSERRRSARR